MSLDNVQCYKGKEYELIKWNSSEKKKEEETEEYSFIMDGDKYVLTISKGIFLENLVFRSYLYFLCLFLEGLF